MGTAWDLVLELAKTPVDHTECILWQLGTSRQGYGRFRHPETGKAVPAHRAVCLQVRGDPPSPMHIDCAHACGIKACVNPNHLRWATRKENMADKVIHGTALRGEKALAAKVTEAQVVEIRLLYAAGGVTQAQLGERFGLHYISIGLIVSGQNWPHAPGPRVENPKARCRGSGNANAKLTSSQIRELRERYAAGGSALTLARAFGVSRTHIYRLVMGRSSPDEPGPITRRTRKGRAKLGR